MNRQKDNFIIYKRGLSREFPFLLVLLFGAIGLTLFLIDHTNLLVNQNDMLLNILLIIDIIFFLLALIWNIALCIRNNQIIKNGRVIFAKIDHEKSVQNHTIYCTYIEEGKNKIFVAEYGWIESLKRANFGVPEYEYIEYVPVVVDEKNYDKYLILIDDLLWYFSSGIYRTIHFTGKLREIQLPQYILRQEVTPIHQTNGKKLRLIMCTIAAVAWLLLVYVSYLIFY